MAAAKKVGIKEVAREAKVSLAVASLALSDRTHPGVRYGEATRDRVHAAALRLNYRPNRTARNLQNRHHNAIAVYTGRSIYSVHDRTLNKLLECCREKGIFPVLETVPPDRDFLPVSLREQAIDGAIVFADVPGVEAELERVGLPLVHVNTNRRHGANCITYDEGSGIDAALVRFNEIGKTRSGYVGVETAHYSNRERAKAFQRAMGPEAPLLELDGRIADGAERQSTMDRMGEWLSMHSYLDSVIIHADAFAPLFYHAAARLGKRIPEDIAVIAYNDLGVSQLIQPEVTSLAVDYPSLAALSFAMLRAMIDGTVPDGPVTVPYQLVLRRSA